ncbi:MAG TPA: methyltransferase domain-containing protein [Pyrinomonadaceae bacterium]
MDEPKDSSHPGRGLKTERMPGHWVLARLGKRVLRPGGMQLTGQMLARLRIDRKDRVVEFAPGMGVTARLTLDLGPQLYTAVERDEAAAKIVSTYLKGEGQRCVVGSASDTGLPDQSATVVYGEAMLTMQTEEMKHKIVNEAYRLLASGGRYGIHEMCLTSEQVADSARKEIEHALTGVVHHGVKPLSVSEWQSLLISAGFEIQSVDSASMSLLEPRRLISDEGYFGFLRFVVNVVRDSEARHRVLEMRSTFKRYREELGAIALVAIKR